MSFRRDLSKVKYILWKGEEPRPSAGSVTVYYWTKGNPGETWVKADICFANGNWQYGILADSLNHLKIRVAEFLSDGVG